MTSEEIIFADRELIITGKKTVLSIPYIEILHIEYAKTIFYNNRLKWGKVPD